MGTLDTLLAMLTVQALLVDARPLGERVSEDPKDEMATVRGPLYRTGRHLTERCCWQRELVRGRRALCWRTSPVQPHFVKSAAAKRKALATVLKVKRLRVFLSRRLRARWCSCAPWY